MIIESGEITSMNSEDGIMEYKIQSKEESLTLQFTTTSIKQLMQDLTFVMTVMEKPKLYRIK